MRGRTSRPAVRMNIRAWPSGPNYTAARDAILAERRYPDPALQRPHAPHETSGCILHLLWSVRGVLLLPLVETVAVGSDSPAGFMRRRVWDTNVGDWPVALAGLGCLSVVCVQMLGQAAPVRAWPGWVQVSSHRSLASRQRRVRMP